MKATASLTSAADDLVGQSGFMRRLRDEARAVAASDVNLLLEGESGTGKELVARTVHSLSARCEAPLVAVNCAAIHEGLLESELFGHEAGAFTGASHATIGFFRAAEGGSILLDEIGDMSRSLQAKLLRVLEERAVIPVGRTTPVPIDVRVISATNQNLTEAVERGTFRRDLYYRINVVRLRLPPLRERPEDIVPLARHLLASIGEALDVPVKRLPAEVVVAMTAHDWPGNVRELGNVIQRAYVMGRGPTLRLDDLPEEILHRAGPASPAELLPLQEAICRHVCRALELAGGVRSRAAKMLGIDRKSLWRMMHRYDIT